MKKHPINLSALKYNDTCEFINRFIKDFESSNVRVATDTNLNSLYTSLLQQAPVYENALKKIKAKKQAEALFLLDRDRDKKFFTLRRAIFVFRYSDNQSELEAYKNLKISIRSFINTEKNSFENEIKAINDFIFLLRSDKNLSHLKVLKIEKYVNNLALSNTNFSSLLGMIVKDIEEDNLYDIKVLRKKLLNIYRELAEYILVMAKRKRTPYYIKTLTALNEGRIHFAEMLVAKK